MNCYDWLDRAERYANSVWDQYALLLSLEQEGKKDSKEYLEELKNLKEIVEFERMFYGLMSEHELNFLYRKTSEPYDIPTFSVINHLMIEYTDEDYIKIRVAMKAIEEQQRKEYPILKDMKQTGMIPLYPSDEEEPFFDLVHKSNLIWGSFTSILMAKIFEEGKYEKDFTDFFKYITAYTLTPIENYFLHHDFSIESKSLLEISDIISSVYNNDLDYQQYCFDSFKEIVKVILETLASFKPEELENNEEKTALLVLIETLSSILLTIPYRSSLNIYESIDNKNINPEILKIIKDTLKPLIEEKGMKAKILKN